MLQPRLLLIAVALGLATAQADELPPGALLRLGTPQAPPRNERMAVAFSPDGKLLATGSSKIGLPGTATLWDASSGKELFRLPGHTTGVLAVVFSPAGTVLATMTDDLVVRLWRVSTGKQLATLDWQAEKEGQLRSRLHPIAFSPDGKTLATGAGDDSIRIWEVATGKELHRWPAPPGNGVAGLAYSPDGRLLAVGLFYSLHLWDAATGKPVRQLGEEEYLSHALAFAPDGKTLAVVTQMKAALWDVSSGVKRWEYGRAGQRAFHDVAFAPDGKTFAVARYNEPVRLWDTLTLTERRRLYDHPDGAASIAFSPDGRRLALGTFESTAFVWSRWTPPEKPRDPVALWADLGKDASRADEALGELLATPGPAVALLKEHVRLVQPVDAAGRERIARWLADLDADDFDTRDKARAGLENLGELAEPFLRRALEARPSADVARQVRGLLQTLADPATSPERLRGLRAIEVLESITDPEAKRLLEALASGAPESRRTREARTALERLRR
jgi:WD40 repeat protein